MHRYSEWFAKELSLIYEYRFDRAIAYDAETVPTFLRMLGYRIIHSDGSTTLAERGLNMWYMIKQSLFSCRLSYGSDPTLHFHATQIVLTPDSLVSRSTIQSWYSLGTQQDTAVFAAEFDMLKQYLADGTCSDTSLLEAQELRRASDKRTMIIVVGVAIFTGISILAALIGIVER